MDRRAQMTVLFSHANAEDVSVVFAWLRELSLRLGVNVLSYSYTGYARSSKPPSELDVYADVDAAWDCRWHGRSIRARRRLLAERRRRPDAVPRGAALGGRARRRRRRARSPILSVFRIAFDFRYPRCRATSSRTWIGAGAARAVPVFSYARHAATRSCASGTARSCSWRRGRSGA